MCSSPLFETLVIRPFSKDIKSTPAFDNINSACIMQYRRLQEDPAYIVDTQKWLEEADEVKRLGQGTDGWVALWKHRTTGRAVAIKAIDTTYAGNMETVIRNLRNEFSVMSKLGIHPNIVQVVGWCGDFYNSPHGMPALLLEGADLGSMGK